MLSDAYYSEIGSGGLLVEGGDIRADELVEGVDLLVDFFGELRVDLFGGVSRAVVTERDRTGQTGELGARISDFDGDIGLTGNEDGLLRVGMIALSSTGDQPIGSFGNMPKGASKKWRC